MHESDLLLIQIFHIENYTEIMKTAKEEHCITLIFYKYILTIVLLVLLSKKKSLSERSNL